MKIKLPDRRELAGRLRRPKTIGLIAVAVAVLAAVWWCLPRREVEFVSIDGAHRWQSGEVPPQRNVLWPPAETIDDLPELPPDVRGVLRPQYAAGESVLYFTARLDDGSYDIYRAARSEAGWQTPEPVVALNSSHDDIGPVIRADGKELYLYSNRSGGFGGFDLYMAKWNGSAWSEAENLGARVNSVAHEYDPAISPDGDRIYFASSRTEAVDQKLRGEDAIQPGTDWDATLRAAANDSQFDLFAAQWSTETSGWTPARRLSEINRDDSNEGAPFVSPDGRFLYFASDRATAGTAEQNYDIYRAAIDSGQIGAIEDLGSGVNTSANETEPALSSGGFRLVFSRELGRADNADSPQYDLFSSTAQEVRTEVAWDNSRFAALATFIKANWWELLLFVLLVALLIATVWALRRVSWQRAPIPGFLLIALLVHILLGIGSFFLHVGGEFASRVREAFVETTIAEAPPAPDPNEKQPFSQVADLESVEAEVTDVERQTYEPTETVVPENVEMKPTISSRVARELPPDEVVSAPPVEARPQVEDEAMSRRSTLMAAAIIEQPAPLESEAPAPTSQDSIARPTDVSPQRQQSESDVEPVPEPLSRVATAPRSTPSEISDVESTPHPNSGSLPDVAEQLARAQSIALEAITEPAEPEKMASVAPQGSPGEAESLPRTSVDIGKQATEVGGKPLDQVAQQFSGVQSRAALEAGDLAAAEEQQAVAQIALPGEIADALGGRHRAQPTTIAETAEKLASGEMKLESTFDPVDGLAQSANVGQGKTETAGGDSNPDMPQARFAPQPSVGDSSSPQPDDESLAVASSLQTLDGVRSEFSRSRFAVPTPEGLVETDPVRLPTGALSEAAALSSPTAGIAVDVQRIADASGPDSELPSQIASSGVRLAGHSVLGEIEAESMGSPVEMAALDGEFSRRSGARLAEFMIPDVGSAAMLQRRANMREALVDQFGGSDATEAAVRLGLKWIAEHQESDGRWTLDRFDNGRSGNQKSGGHGSVRSDTAATGLALLPFLAAGHTHRAGSYQETVDRGMKWLLEQQKESGELFIDKTSNAQMYSHGIATIALCELYGMSRDPALRYPAERAVKFIVEAQHTSGGWRYKPLQSGDTSVVGWQVMALKSAEMAGIDVPAKTLQGTRTWLSRVGGKGSRRGWFGYQSPNDRNNDPAMTAEALLCLQYLGTPKGDELLQKGAGHLLENLPELGKSSSYYWYYGTQVMFHLEGYHWQRWNEAIRDVVVGTQHQTGAQAGTWDPKDQWERGGGRLYATSLRLLMLEVYYRHLPLYRTQ